jgi:hypothetical protein
MADTVDAKLAAIAQRLHQARVDQAAEYIKLLLRDADALLDAKLAATHAVVQ